MNKNYLIMSLLCLSNIIGVIDSKQKFFFKNKTDKPCSAKFYYDAAQNVAQYVGFPIQADDESWLSLKEFWWFEKRGLGLIKNGKSAEPVDVLMHHVANNLTITIPGFGERTFKITDKQTEKAHYSIKIFLDESNKIEITFKKKEIH